MYKKDEYVVIVHPDYPDEHGIARVVSNPCIPTLLTLEKSADKSRCMAHTDFVRRATIEEVNELS